MTRRFAVLVLVAGLLLPLAPPGASGAKRRFRIIDNIIVRSRDDTPIVATLMLPRNASRRNKVPAILMTHGWGGSRETRPSSTTRPLLRHGYAVLTWDSRGFGESGGPRTSARRATRSATPRR